jgi:hypothetical protein
MNNNIMRHDGKAIGDAKLEQMLEHIKERIKVDAQNRGAKNLPPLNNRRLTGYFEEHHLAFQQLVDDNGKDILFKSTCDEVVEHRSQTDARLLELDNQLYDVQHQQIATNATLKNTNSPYSHARVVLIWVLVLIITQLDGILSMPVWQALGLSVIASIWAGIIFATGLSILSYFFERLVQKGKTVLQRRLIGFSIMAFVTVLFSFMAVYRANHADQYLNDNGIHDSHVPPLLFVFLSVFFFSVAVIIKHLAFPTKAQREQKRDHDRAVKEKCEIDNRYQRLSAAKAAIKQEHAIVRKNNTEKLERGSITESIIISAAHQGYTLYKKYNQNSRPDCGHPVSFDEPYPHTFKTYFHTINQL